MSKVNLKTASRNKKASFDLSSTHITTLDVGQLRPTYITPLYAGEDINLKYSQFSRLSPLVAPTFGSFRLKSYAFFVPHRVVFPSYDDFRSGSADATVYKSLPWITTTDISDALLQRSNSYVTVRKVNGVDRQLSIGIAVELSPDASTRRYWIVRNNASDGNFSIVDVGSETKEYTSWDAVVADFQSLLSLDLSNELSAFVADGQKSRFNPDYWTATRKGINIGLSGGSYEFAFIAPQVLNSEGRWLYNIFLSLGYAVDFSASSRITELKGVSSQTYSLLPMLSFCRVLFDYVYPSQWVQQQGFGELFQDWDEQKTFDSLLKLLLVTYDKDFYTQLWTDFNSPAPGFRNITEDSFSAFGLSASDAVVAGDDGNATLNSSLVTVPGFPASFSNLTASGLRLLQSISDYVTRRNIGGSRFRDWMKSHFGFVTQEQKSHYSTFLKSWSDEIKISDVTNTSVGDSSVLGEQAGRGIGYSNGSLKFTADEDGFFVVLSMVIPIVGYYQGLKPWCRLARTPEDLYLPEFDSMGNQPVPCDELFYDFKNPAQASLATASGYSPQGVFGFAPRYNEYKRGFDFLTGDFRLDSRNVGLDSYHTMRVLPSPTKANPLVLDAEFLRVDNQYNRIFAQDPTDDGGSSQYDKIFTIFQFNVTAHRHMLTISESIPLFDKQGRDVTLTMNGNSI